MAATGPGLEDVLGLALKSWRPENDERRGALFGAAGRRGPGGDPELTSLTHDPAYAGRGTAAPSPPTPQADAMGRLFATSTGRQAANAVGNETRTLSALERLSLEVMAEALRLTGAAGADARLMVLPARDRRPPVLLLLSPEVRRLEASRLVSEELDLPLPLLREALGSAADAREDSPEAAAFRVLLEGGEQAVAELFLIARPQVVLTRRPQMIPLCAPVPHLAVESGARRSTAGVLCRDGDGELGVTACLHGTGPAGTAVTVGLRDCRVKQADPVQDIVFLPLGDGFNQPPLEGLGGVLQDREPARAEWVRFDGATNQNRRTRIFGTDTGLLRAQPSVQLRLQTDPDTDEGDSGAALLDEQDRVLGFAFQRTGYDDYPQFTDWIWAANALRALDLTAL